MEIDTLIVTICAVGMKLLTGKDKNTSYSGIAICVVLLQGKNFSPFTFYTKTNMFFIRRRRSTNEIVRLLVV